MHSYVNANDALRSISHGLALTGHTVHPRGFETFEENDYLLEIVDPLDGICTIKDRKVNYKLVAFEFASYLGGLKGLQWHADLMCQIAPNYRAFVDDTTGKLNGMYGAEIGPQMPHVLESLSKDPDTRQARITIFQPDDLERSFDPLHPGHDKDIPCTCAMHFRIRFGKLDMTVEMRSNDVHLGATYDFAAFTLIQQVVAALLGREVGRYRHFANSMHMYKNWPYDYKEVLSTMQGKETVELYRPDFSSLQGGGVDGYFQLRAQLAHMVSVDLPCYLEMAPSGRDTERLKFRRNVDLSYKEKPLLAWVWRGITGRMVDHE